MDHPTNRDNRPEQQTDAPRMKDYLTPIEPMRYLSIVVLLFTNLGLLQGAEPSRFTEEQLTFFEQEVKPLLKAHCTKCHGEGKGKLKGDLDLTRREGILKGGETGPSVKLDKPEESLLLKALHYTDKNLEMPPEGKLPAAKIEVFTKWVKVGLPMKDFGTNTAAKEPEPKGGKVTEEAKKHWAYQPIKKPEIPQVKGVTTNPIDHFILAKLEAKGVPIYPPAEKLHLIRRVTYDLTGLPPTPEEIDSFLNDSSPNAYEKLVDRLLASEAYGEKWARHWLDVVRYGETNGYERDGAKPYVWRYRDYVIRSFNADKPYDQFIKEQLAGDEFPQESADAIIATGYYRLGLWDDEPADPKQSLFDELDDFVATTSQTFLATTLNCVRCHEHKVDPFPHADYYKFAAFFRDIRHYSNDRNTASAANMRDITDPEKRKVYEGELGARKTKIAELTKQLEALENEVIKKMSAEDQRASEGIDRPLVVAKAIKMFDEKQRNQYNALKKERTELEKKPNPPQELALAINNCYVQPPKTHIMIRGNPHSPGAEVEPAFPEIFGLPKPVIPAPAKGAKSSGRRTVLANWIASRENPLTARVMVNRIWHYHFGKGIVPTPSDFGKLGQPPSHPELLDWLASDFMQEGWKIKRVHKLILMSQTYRRSAVEPSDPKVAETALRLDPGNILLGRFPMRRLTAEEVRDSILQVSGQLNRKMYGPSVYPKIPREVLAGQSVPGAGWPTSPPEEGNRRSIYVHIKRSLQVPILITHDQADPDSPCPVRYTTTVPTQSLGMLNGEFTNLAAKEFVKRLNKEAPNDLNQQIARVIRLTTGRIASEKEIQKDAQFIQELRTKHKLSEEESLRQYCLLALNTNEFLYLD